MSEGARYVPAAGYKALARLYDPALAFTVREGRFRRLLEDRLVASLPHGGTVVDVGCGTGTFAIALARRRPDAQVIGVDGDASVLSAARAKRGSEGVTWHEGLADRLDLDAGSAGAVVMSLLLHHLGPSSKTAALSEALRVLRPGGRLHIADWGRPRDPVMRGAFFLLQALDGFANTRDHAAGRLPDFVRTAGFTDVTSHAQLRTVWGLLELIEAGGTSS